MLYYPLTYAENLQTNKNNETYKYNKSYKYEVYIKCYCLMISSEDLYSLDTESVADVVRHWRLR